MRIRKKIKTIFLVLFCASVLLYSLISLFKIITTKAPDFQIFYYSTLDFLKEINPYTDRRLFTIYNYPPETNLVYLPLILFNYQTAQTIYILLSYLSVFLIVYYSLKIIRPKFSPLTYWLVICFILLSFPVKFTLGMGQSNLIAYLLLIISYYFFKQEKSFYAGLFLGIAIIFKPIFIFVYIFYAFQKSYKTILMATLVIFVFTITIFLIRPAFHAYYFKSLINNVFSFTGTEVYYNQGILGFISRLTSDVNTRKIALYISSSFILVLTAFCLIKNKSKKDLQFALILTVLPIINIMSWQHHFVILIFPFIVAYYLLKDKKILIIILTLVYVLVSFNIKKPVCGGLISNLILSHQFFGAFLLYLLLISKKNNISS